MTGYPEHNWPLFNKVAAMMRADNIEVVNPTELGHTIGDSHRLCLGRDIPELLTCDGIVLLPGWADSAGAKAELEVSRACGLEIKVVILWKVIGSPLPYAYALRDEAYFQPKSEPVKALGQRFNSGKPRISLIPPRPILELAKLYTKGAEKYGDRNWEKGLSWLETYDAMERHMLKWLGGEDFDEEDGQHHMDSVAWGALALREFAFTHPELDDRSKQITNNSDKTV